MPVKMWLPWKRQVTWAVAFHIKLLPDKFWKKSPSLVAVALIFKKMNMNIFIKQNFVKGAAFNNFISWPFES